MEPRLEISCRILCALVSQDRNRRLSEHEGEVRHAVALADMLIAQCDDEAQSSPAQLRVEIPSGRRSSEEQIQIRAAVARYHQRADQKRAVDGPNGSGTLH